MTERTNADAIVDVAQQAVRAQEIDPTKLMAVRDGTVVLDGEKHLASPRRKAGRVVVYDAASLEEYFAQQGLESGNTTTLYANRATFELIAVFNDHKAGPGWRDHRAALKTRPTPEWRHWSEKDGRLLSQVDFAEHIEQGLLEVVEPDGADILELAQTFEANQRVAFKQATTLADGSRQLVYEQQIEAKAGQRGQLTIPKEFILAVAPFEGSPPYKIVARLRYRIEDERLKIGYTLVRPHDVLNAAFDDIVTQVERGTSHKALRGTADA